MPCSKRRNRSSGTLASADLALDGSNVVRELTCFCGIAMLSPPAILGGDNSFSGTNPMERREIKDALRRSTVIDLLDDGIENGSDLKSPHRKRKDGDRASAAHPSGDASRGESDALVPAAKVSHPTTESTNKSISYSGVFIGVGFVIAGAVMLASPHDLNVYHAAMRRHAFVEHIAKPEMMVYAVIAIIFGIALCAYSLYRPRK